LRLEDASAAKHWQGWRLEVTDTSGDLVLTINLDQFRRETLLVAVQHASAYAIAKLNEHLANVIPHGMTFLST
jgi:hypothetical protein